MSDSESDCEAIPRPREYGKPIPGLPPEEDWRTVPGYSPDKLRVNRLGYMQIFNRTSWGKPTRGTKDANGYMTVRILHSKRAVHDLICTSFYGTKRQGETANHIAAKDDNSVSNIVGWASKSEQITSFRKKQQRRRDSKAILVWKYDDTSPVKTEFPSFKAAKKETGAANLSKVANGLVVYCTGFNKIRYAAEWAKPLEPQSDLEFEGYQPGYQPREEWRSVGERLLVSNRGRAQYKDGKKLKLRFTPYIRTGLAYSLVSAADKRARPFHVLVFDAFFPDVRNGRSVDHINRDKTDNTLINLRPASSKEQALNQTRKPSTERAFSLKKAIKARKIGTKEWVMYPEGINHVARTLQNQTGTFFNPGNVAAAARRSGTSSGWEFRFV